MNEDYLILKIEGEKVYVGEDIYLSFQQIGFPAFVKYIYCTAYWSIKIIDIRDNEIFAEVASYASQIRSFPLHQLEAAELLSHVKAISFRTLNTSILLKYSRNPDRTPIAPNLNYESMSAESQEDENASEPEFSIAISNDTPPDSVVFSLHEEEEQNEAEVYKDIIRIEIKNLDFQFGCVGFKLWFQPLRQEIGFQIQNTDIREEFDAVKNYFAKILRTKTITAHIEVGVTASGEIAYTKASSPEIRRINKSTIESVKFEFVKLTSKSKLAINVDKSLFTMDEMYDAFAEGGGAYKNPFFDSDQDMFDSIINIKKTKHYQHLCYLSSLHCHQIMKLRFILSPFSFIFLLEGEVHYYIVWETLDSKEATYVWKVQKDKLKLKQQLLKIEDIINTIKVQGKIAYINTEEEMFQRVFHDYSDIKNGFVKWKSQLDACIK